MKKLILLMALISMFLIGVVNAADITCEIIKPDSSDTVTTGTILNASFKGGTGNATINLYINFSSSSTANSSVGTLISTTSNLTGVGLMANGSINTSFLGVLEDANNYNVEMAVEGGDGNGRADCTGTASNVIVDRTSPSVPTTSHSANTEFDGVNTKTITYTVTGTDTTSCRIAFGRTTFSGTNTFAMTHSGNSCTYTVTKATIPDDVYTTYVQASDGTNTSISAGRDFKIKTFEGVAGDEISALSVPIAQKVIEQVNLGTVVLVIIFGVFGYMAFFKKK